MARAYNLEVEEILKEARQFSQTNNKPLSSIYLFLAFYLSENSARLLLKERHIGDSIFVDFYKTNPDEPPEMMPRIMSKAEELASSSSVKEVTALHLFAAALMFPECAAFNAMRTKLSKTNIDNVKSTAISYINGNMPRKYLDLFEYFKEKRRRNIFNMGISRRVDAEPEIRQSDSSEQKSPTSESAAQFSMYKSGEFILPPVLAEICRDVSRQAREGKFDPVIGRDGVINEILDVLGKRKSNNPCLVGDLGVGKTAIIEGLAQKLVNERPFIPGFDDPVILQLDISSVVAGTQYRGALAEKMRQLKAEVAQNREKVIIFIDEIHTIAQAGNEGVAEIARDLKEALSRGEFPCIGATTYEEFRSTIGQDVALSRRFQLVDVPEVSQEEAKAILRQLAERYQEHHKVVFTDAVIDAAVRLSARYIPERRLPDKAINLLDLVGSRASRERKTEISYEDLAKVVSQVAGVPDDQITIDPSSRLAMLERIMGAWVIGHEDVLASVGRTIRRHYAGFSADRPIGSFLFLGPTGVGKTETAKALAKFLFGSPDHMVRVDMSEYGEPHNVARLIGSPPGYVGHDAGGQLTEAIRKRPFQVILFDEIEKGHPDVWKILLQVLDDGRLTDGQGKTVSFVNTVIIMTSNLGSHLFRREDKGKQIGFAAAQPTGDETIVDETTADVFDYASNAFPPELWNRIDEKIVFKPLSRQQAAKIAEIMLKDSNDRLARSRKITYNWNADVVEFLLDKGGFDPQYGARPLRRTIENRIEATIAHNIAIGKLRSGCEVFIAYDAEKDDLTFEIG